MLQLHFQLRQNRILQPAEAILSKAVTEKPDSVPTAATQIAMDKWLKAHQAQFKGQAVAFKKHVAQARTVCKIRQPAKLSMFQLQPSMG